MTTLVVRGRPLPADPADQQRWEWQGRRYDMLTGDWQHHADDRLHSFFADDVRELLPDAELSCNPFASFVQQTSTLYDDTPITTANGADLGPLSLERLWCQQQETLMCVQGMLECAVRWDWDRRHQRMRYRIVPAHNLVIVPDPDDPTSPGVVHELRERHRAGGKVWTWETWDPKAGKLSIRLAVLGEGVEQDVTAEFYDGKDSAGKPEPYPYRDRAGDPILPYELYHSRIPMGLWQPRRGEELVRGSLTASALWTFWLGGVRDLAYPRRAIVDGDIDYGRVAAQNGTAAAATIFTISPHHILPVRSTTEGRTAKLDQWDSQMDAEASGRAVAHFIAQMALYAGISPADISIGSAGLSRTSGFAIEVSRDGQRKARRRIITPMSLGDRSLLASAGRLVNRILGGERLPERPDDYSITYCDVGKTPEEQLAELKVIEAKRAMGAISQIDVIRAANPSLDEAGAEEMAIRIATVDGLMLEAKRLAAEPAPTMSDAPAAAPEVIDSGAPVGADKAQDTALNGAQVTAALAIVQQVAEGRLPRASAVEMLAAFFNLPTERADSIIGEVGRTFFADIEDAQEVTSARGPAEPDPTDPAPGSGPDEPADPDDAAPGAAG